MGIRVGVCGVGAFADCFIPLFKAHPLVEQVILCDLDAAKVGAKAARFGLPDTSPSLDHLCGTAVDAVAIFTQNWLHGPQAVQALQAGKHVYSAVPSAITLDEITALVRTVAQTGRIYMVGETSYYYPCAIYCRQRFQHGDFGQIVYAEGEYYHYAADPIASWKDWRVGTPPQWYPTHSNAYYVGVTGDRFTEVSCMGMPSAVDHLKPENNAYGNPFGTEIALFRTSEGGMARMAVSWDTPGVGGEMGRIRTQRGTFYGSFQGDQKPPAIARPPLPPGVEAGGHGGSHGYLMAEFVEAILLGRRPLVDVAQSLNMTVAGIVAHQSALRDGERMKIPQYVL